MAVKILAVFAFALLFSSLFLSGCLWQQGGEQSAIELADSTGFGKFLDYMAKANARGHKCDFDKFAAVFQKLGGSFDDMDTERGYFETAKTCIPTLEKKAEKIRGSEYSVGYSFTVPDTCKNQDLAEFVNRTNPISDLNSKSVLVNFETGETKEPPLPEGEMMASSWDELYILVSGGEAQDIEFFGGDVNTVRDCDATASLAGYLKRLEVQASQPSGTPEPAGQPMSVGIPPQ